MTERTTNRPAPGKQNWLIFAVPVVVSCVVMLVGAVVLPGGGESPRSSNRTVERLSEDEERDGDEPEASSKKSRIPRGDEAPSRLRGLDRRDQAAASDDVISDEDIQLENELDAADAEEIERSPEMDARVRQRLRQGKGFFGPRGPMFREHRERRRRGLARALGEEERAGESLGAAGAAGR